MIPITHVLCPIDFSDISQHALAHAAAIARWYEARLTVLYVFVNLPTMDAPPLVLDDTDRERLMTQMRQFAALVPSTVPIEFRIQEGGFAHDEIVAQIAATHADLLVLGTHGRSGFQRIVPRVGQRKGDSEIDVSDADRAAPRLGCRDGCTRAVPPDCVSRRFLGQLTRCTRIRHRSGGGGRRAADGTSCRGTASRPER